MSEQLLSIKNDRELDLSLDPKDNAWINIVNKQYNYETLELVKRHRKITKLLNELKQ